MKKKWVVEDVFTLVKALELRLSPIGFHVALMGADFRKTGDDPRLRIYGGVITAAERANIVSLLEATEMHLQSMDTKHGFETWVYGRGKNERLLELVFD